MIIAIKLIQINCFFHLTGADFNNVSFTVEVPAETTALRITNITIVDDNINEREEVFVLVARILDQAAGVACFQLDENSPCKSKGHIGGTQLSIRDNDGKCIYKYSCIHNVFSITQTCSLDFLKEDQQ